MQMVIKIPDEVKQIIDKNINECDLDIYDCVLLAVKNGTSLPKGHGRLIDADNTDEITLSFNEKGRFKILAPTIIEADRSKANE